MKSMQRDPDAIEELYAAAHRRVSELQGGSPSYFDNHVQLVANFLKKARGGNGDHTLEVCDQISDASMADAVARLLDLVRRREKGRYLDCAATWNTRLSRDVDSGSFIRSQGTSVCFSWKGIPVLKSIYDIGMYTRLIEELRPATLLEIGSGVGGSALWFRDQLEALEIHCKIVSMDIRPPKLDIPGVSFLHADCNALASHLTSEMIAHWPKPWLVIEDAHVAVRQVLLHLDNYVETGDYLVIEDSEAKRTEMAAFVSAARGQYVIDSYFTDFFGINATSAADSILIRM